MHQGEDTTRLSAVVCRLTRDGPGLSLGLSNLLPSMPVWTYIAARASSCHSYKLTHLLPHPVANSSLVTQLQYHEILDEVLLFDGIGSRRLRSVHVMRYADPIPAAIPALGALMQVQESDQITLERESRSVLPNNDTRRMVRMTHTRSSLVFIPSVKS